MCSDVQRLVIDTASTSPVTKSTAAADVREDVNDERSNGLEPASKRRRLIMSDDDDDDDDGRATPTEQSAC